MKFNCTVSSVTAQLRRYYLNYNTNGYSAAFKSCICCYISMFYVWCQRWTFLISGCMTWARIFWFSQRSRIKTLTLLITTSSGVAKVESHASPETQPSRTAFWHNARVTWKQATPMCRRKHRTPGDRISVHVPGPPQESLSAMGQGHPCQPNPPLTRTTLANCAQPVGLLVSNRDL